LNVPLRQLVGIADDLFDFQSDGGPDWQRSRRFDIQARTKDPLFGTDPMRPMPSRADAASNRGSS
jgi:hypothetical protein